MTWLRRQFRSFARCCRWWRLRLTLTGKLLTIAILLGLPGVTSLDSPLFLFSCGLLVLLAVSELSSRWMFPHLDARFISSGQVERNTPLDVYLRLHNLSRRRAFEIRVVLETGDCWSLSQSSYRIDHLAPDEQLQLAVQLLPVRRGVFALPAVCVESTFPLNITRIVRRLRPGGEVTVTPNCRPLSELAAAGRAGQDIADRLQQRLTRGFDGDYVGSRDYVPGTPVRRWDNGSWARLGQPIVREYSQPRDGHVRLIVDCHTEETADSPLKDSTRRNRKRRRGAKTARNEELESLAHRSGILSQPTADADFAEIDHALEAMLSAAASVSFELSLRNQSILTLVLGNECHSVTAMQATQSHLEVLRQLARATPSADALDMSQLLQSLQVDPSSELVILVSRQHDGRPDRLERALHQARVPVIAVDVTVASPPTDDAANFTIAVRDFNAAGVMLR